jgi:hypothetical protein
MSKDTDKDPLFKALAMHLARIGYTASSIASMPDGFGPTTLERMGTMFSMRQSGPGC